MSSNETLPPTNEDFLVAVEEALETHLLPTPGFAVLERTRDAVVAALGPLVQQLRGAPAASAAAPPAPADLPDRLRAVLTERFTELGNPFAEMRRQEKGPDGWPASHPLGPNDVAEVLRELLMADEAQQPETQAADRPAESTLYQVVGDWGTESAVDAEEARAAVASWLSDHPHSGARAEQRIYREWPDGSEFYGPWTDLPEPSAAVSQPGREA